jgi:hypothetical protein
MRVAAEFVCCQLMISSVKMIAAQQWGQLNHSAVKSVWMNPHEERNFAVQRQVFHRDQLLVVAFLAVNQLQWQMSYSVMTSISVFQLLAACSAMKLISLGTRCHRHSAGGRRRFLWCFIMLYSRKRLHAIVLGRDVTDWRHAAC